MNYRFIRKHLLGLIIISLIPFNYNIYSSFVYGQTNPKLRDLEELAKKRYWQGDFFGSIELWESLIPSLPSQEKAEVYSYLGVAYQQIGKLERSLDYFRESLNLTPQTEQGARIKIAMAKIFHQMGHPNQAIAVATEALDILNPDSYSLQAGALQAIATGFLLKGELETAVDVFQQARQLAQDNTLVFVEVSNDLGIALLKRRDFLENQAFLAEQEGYEDERLRLKNLAQQDEALAKTLFLRNVETIQSQELNTSATTQAYLNAFKVSGDQQYLSKAEASLHFLPNSRTKSELLLQISQLHPEPTSFIQEAISLAEALGDYRMQSLARGEMGAYYEKIKRLDLALQFTEQAKVLAQTGSHEDILYRWQWQAGRIYHLLDKKEKAEISYLGATATLQTLRLQIANANPDLQINFFEEVQPIYRDLLALLLEKGDNLNNEQIKEIINIRRQLELSELQAFFGDACSELQQQQKALPKRVQPRTAKIYFILLERNSYQIVELPDGSRQLFSLGISRKNLEAKLLEWRKMLLTARIPKGYEPLSRELYDLLLRQALSSLPPQTQQLIFVGDGLLRNVPLAALMNQEEFLLQKYAIAYALSLPVNLPQQRNRYKSIAFGLSVKTEYFPALPFVKNEIASISEKFSANSFLDENFTAENFKEQIQKDYNIIHIATHAIFLGSAQETFFQTFDSVVNLTELETLLRKASPINILFLSACRTAAGNERSVLGMAGVGARVGVANIVASLWSVRDETTSVLVSDFYSTLREIDSPSESLRQIQLKMIDFHPKTWASFIVIIND